MCEHHSLFFPRVFFMPVFYARSSTGQSSLNVLRTHTKKKKPNLEKKEKKKMKLKIIVPLIIVLLSFYATETEAFGFGAIIRVIQRLIRLAAEMARRGKSVPFRRLGSSTQALAVRSGPPGARQIIKNGLSKVKNVVSSPKFQAGLLVAEGADLIIDAAITANQVEVSYENFTDTELQSEWEVSNFIHNILTVRIAHA